jgi:hypothetical protein
MENFNVLALAREDPPPEVGETDERCEPSQQQP